MATGAVTAREPKAEAAATTETAATNGQATETGAAQPHTLKGRFLHLLHWIFQGREEHLGWHQ